MTDKGEITKRIRGASRGRRWARRLTLGLAATVLLLLSPAGRLLERAVDAHLTGMHRRHLAGRSTGLDVWQCRVLYGAIGHMGGLCYPEAGAIIRHYLAGSGRDLWLPADYLRRSPVVRRHLATLRPGQTRVVTLRQAEDWRLSYALNPFRLRRGPDGKVEIWQWMAFLPDPRARTVLHLGLVRFTVPDGLILILRPKPFMARCAWRE
jgi:hypothetical protein